MFTLTELADGNLEVTFDDAVTAEDIDDLRHDMTRLDEVAILQEGTESYWTNGGYRPFSAADANPAVGMTEAPCIAEDIAFHDDGRAEVVGKLWWFPNYAVESFLDTLIASRRVVFTLAQ